MGYTDCKSAAISTPKYTEKAMEFLRLATMVRIVLMYYLNLEKFFNQPDADLNKMLAEVSESPPQKPDFD